MRFSRIFPFVLGDTYLVKRPIGRGAQAIIYKGHCLTTKKAVAIKSMKEDSKSNEKDMLYFLQKKRGAGTFVPKILDVVIDDMGNENIITEYIHGVDLFDWFEERNFEPLPNMSDTQNLLKSILNF